jgi:hypothetical protein
MQLAYREFLRFYLMDDSSPTADAIPPARHVAVHCYVADGIGAGGRFREVAGGTVARR